MTKTALFASLHPSLAKTEKTRILGACLVSFLKYFVNFSAFEAKH